MTLIRCDACRKELRDPRKDVSYSTILGRDLCTPCYEKLIGNIRHTMEKRKPYRFSDYKDVLQKTVVRMTSG